MTIDFSATPDDSPTNNTADGPMFAPVPAWERNKKRRGFGGGRASEPRSFAPADEPLAATPVSDALGPLEPTDDAFAAGPTFANRTKKTASSNVPIAIVAGLIVIGGVGAAGWYAMQPHGGQGVAELTPGSATTTTTPDGSVTTQVAEATTPATPAAPAGKATTTTTTARSRDGGVTHRTTTTVRSHAASDTAADASTTAPMPRAAPAPQPASPAAAAPAAAPTPAPAAPLVLTLPPSSAPQSTAPADTPAPVQSAPAPTTAPPPTQTPPTA
ncbi:hypothetical protein [Phenylobacterium sp.]|uniref:hypothetical protein n=1 Tax=Phenylobacterium sp. TaxID=1871053 RepID=UPI0025D682F3|nr:hypothetical protein [Phenylobacterium sp.]